MGHHSKVIAIFQSQPVVHYIFGDESRPEDILRRVEWKWLQERYDEKIYAPKWREILTASVDPVVKGNEITVIAQPWDSYTIQAARRGLEFGLLENSVHGIVIDPENRFLVGIRGGKDLHGKKVLVPAGAVSYRQPFDESFKKEALEEAGLNVYDTQLRGIVEQVSEHHNRLWVFAAHTPQNLSQIVEQHHKAMDFLRRENITGWIEQQKALEKAGYPIDAWENEELSMLEFSEKGLLGVLEDPGYVTGSQGAVYVIGVSIFGDSFRKKAERILGDRIAYKSTDE